MPRGYPVRVILERQRRIPDGRKVCLTDFSLTVNSEAGSATVIGAEFLYTFPSFCTKKKKTVVHFVDFLIFRRFFIAMFFKI